MRDTRAAKKLERQWFRREEQRKKLEQRKRDAAKTQTDNRGNGAGRQAHTE